MKISLPYNWSRRNYQEPVWNYMIQNKEGLRASCWWHRRAGKDLTAINLVAYKQAQRVGAYWHVLPTYKQAKRIVWNGRTKEGRSFLSYFPRSLVSRRVENELTIHLKTGSIYQLIGSDDVDSLVGANPVGVVLSEYALQDPRAWKLISPILRENGGWALFITTPRGHNHAWRLHNMAQDNDDWFHETLVAGTGGTRRDDGSPVISDEDIQKERDQGIEEAIIQQEYYCNADAPLLGAYYANQMTKAQNDGRITRVPWEPKIPVHTAWDLGINDQTCIIFFQTIGMEVRIIDYFEDSGEGLPYYAKKLREQDYVYGEHYAPWDISVRELGPGKSRLSQARSLGIRFRVTPQHAVEDGRDAVRDLLSRCWFDSKNCSHLVEALKSYRKDKDEKNEVFKNQHVHDWASHPADAFRILAMNYRDKSMIVEKPKRLTEDDFVYV